MKLWHLTRTDNIGWDQYRAIIVRAHTEDEAREIAEAKASQYDPEGIWYNPSTKCEEIGLALPGKPAGIVLEDFNQG